MNELPIPAFMEAIRETHGCDSVFTGMQSRVTEKMNDQVVWDGMVLIFDLKDHPTASRCYAWAVYSRVTAVLDEEPVDSPRAAVRAAIAAGLRGG